MYKKINVLVILLVGFALNAQDFELGKVTIAELEQKSHPLDNGADAAILFESGKTYMDYSVEEGFSLVTDVSIRIKIYKKEGYDWANKAVKHYTFNKPKEKVEFSKAVTYNLVDGKIEKTKMKSEGEFTEQINKYWAVKKITMPNVREGSVIEYNYLVRSPYISTLPAWSFQSSIPVNSSKYVTKIPEYFTYNSSSRGYFSPKRNVTSSTKTINYTSKERYGNNVVSTDFTQEKVEYKEIVTTFTTENLPAMKDESYVNNINNYTTSIEHELAMTKYPNSPSKLYSLSWDDVVKTIYDNEDFGNELKKTGYFEENLKPLLSGVSQPMEKAAIIFNYVKSYMNWNEYTGYACNDGVRQAYKNKVGNAAEINLMLTAMLRYAGLNANPVLVSTRSNGIALFPNRTAFNYVISAIELENNVILLDATDKYSLPNILPVRALNWEGRIIRVNGSSTSVNLMPNTNSKDVINILASIDAKGNVTGKARDQYFDYNAFIYRGNFNGVSKESYIEKLENRYQGIEINEYTSLNEKDLSKPVVESFAFIHNGLSEIVGDKIYFSPMLYYTQKENPFTQEKREYPIDFVFPHQDKFTFTIVIPDGYVVESLPKPLSVGMEENLGSFKFNITNAGNQIQVSTIMDINQAMVSQMDYEMLKSFYKQMIDKQNEKIVLKKV